MRSNGAAGGAGVAVAGVAHGAGAEGLLLHLQQRLRPMVAQLDLHPGAKATNVQGVASVAEPAGRQIADRGVQSKSVHLLEDLGSH